MTVYVIQDYDNTIIGVTRDFDLARKYAESHNKTVWSEYRSKILKFDTEDFAKRFYKLCPQK